VNVTGKVAVVTGAAQGLGADIASELARRGARVVVTDLNEDGAQVVAAKLGGLALGADMSHEEEVRRVVSAAAQAYGEVDLWFSNAAYSRASELLAVSDAEWDLAWRLNVLSHVWATRLLLPGMLERGSGCLAQTASAIALTLNHWDASYAVTKRAALAFNEYLAATYSSRGIQVSCFCPRGMRTPRLLDQVAAGSPAARNAMATAVTAQEAARIAVDGIEESRFLILTEDDEIESHRRKSMDYDCWIQARSAQVTAERGGTHAG
jgi:NAD(P)-dependent dehydrogenase (short-subunit alcohol dehydrogenase family)